MGIRIWTEEKIAKLRELYPTHSCKQIADILNVTASAVRTIAIKQRIQKPVGYSRHQFRADLWSAEDKARVAELYPYHTNAEIALIMGRTEASIQNLGNKLGVVKTEEVRLLSCFKKGQTPPNKGKKMPADVYERCKATMFKKGLTPPNAHDFGKLYKRVDSDGRPYWYIKADQRIKPLHTWLWESANGKLPKGFVIRFKDGNTLNCVIENLELITRAENMQRNTIHRYKDLDPQLHSEIYANIQLKKTITDLTKKTRT